MWNLVLVLSTHADAGHPPGKVGEDRIQMQHWVAGPAALWYLLT